MQLKDKVVVVAGGSGVLGSEIARRLNARGSRIVLAGRDRARLEATAADLDEAVVVEFDIRSPGSVMRPVEAALARFGRVDGLVNAAGIVAFGPMDQYPEEVIDDLISTNLLGPLHMMSGLLGRIENGFVVNITGVIAERPYPGMAPYLAAKTGLSAASQALGKELRRRGVLVIDARPPHTETGLVDRAVFGDPPRFPDGLTPEHVARVIVEAIESESRIVPSDSFSVPAGV